MSVNKPDIDASTLLALSTCELPSFCSSLCVYTVLERIRLLPTGCAPLAAPPPPPPATTATTTLPTIQREGESGAEYLGQRDWTTGESWRTSCDALGRCCHVQQRERGDRRHRA